MAMKAIKPRVKKGTAGTVPFFLNNYYFIFSSINLINTQINATYPKILTISIPLEQMLPKKDIFPKSEKPFGYIDANPCINVTFINNKDNITKYLNLSPLICLLIFHSNIFP